MAAENKSLSAIFTSSIEKEWRKILFNSAANQLLKPALKAVIDSVEDMDNITPPLEKIFRAFELCKYDSARVIILGQDPYPTRGHAAGLAFAPAEAMIDKFCPKSLTTILGAVKNDMKFKGKVTSAALYDWAADGVLLINTALTTIVGQSLAHEKVWKKYINHILKSLAKNRDFVWILWGAKATIYEKDITASNPKSKILKWGHPSPLNPANQRDNSNHFSYCNNFSKANEMLLAAEQMPISWIPAGTEINETDLIDKNYIYCGADGACSGNGKSSARAAWAYSIYKGGDVYDTAAGPTSGSEKPAADTEFIAGTNQRAELQAINSLLLHLLDKKDVIETKNIKIISDSKYAIMTISTWAPRWIENDKLQDKKNLDLIRPAVKNISMLKAAGFNIEFVHIRGHQPFPAGGAEYEKLLWNLNDKADKAAVAFVESSRK